MTCACLNTCVKWQMTIEINGEELVVPCSKKAMRYTHNPTDQPCLNMDFIDHQMIQEAALYTEPANARKPPSHKEQNRPERVHNAGAFQAGAAKGNEDAAHAPPDEDISVRRYAQADAYLSQSLQGTPLMLPISTRTKKLKRLSEIMSHFKTQCLFGLEFDLRHLWVRESEPEETDKEQSDGPLMQPQNHQTRERYNLGLRNLFPCREMGEQQSRWADYPNAQPFHKLLRIID